MKQIQPLSRFVKRICISTFRKVVSKSKTNDDEEKILQLYFIHQHLKPEEIAVQMKMDIEQVKEKLIEYNLMTESGTVAPGTFFNIFTGRFHSAKADFIAALKTIKRIDKVNTRTNEVYAQTHSINAKIIKEIVDEMGLLDNDSKELSAGAALGMTRKETWLAGARFGIVLHDIDMVYSERFDYLLKKIIERKDEFYFDQHSDPENWYPNRKDPMFTEYIHGRAFGKESLDNAKKNNSSLGILLK